MFENKKPIIYIREYEKDDYDKVCKLIYDGKGMVKNKNKNFYVYVVRNDGCACSRLTLKLSLIFNGG